MAFLCRTYLSRAGPTRSNFTYKVVIQKQHAHTYQRIVSLILQIIVYNNVLTFLLLPILCRHATFFN
jgi:hypothetical protein